MDDIQFLQELFLLRPDDRGFVLRLMSRVVHGADDGHDGFFLLGGQIGQELGSDHDLSIVDFAIKKECERKV